MSTKQRLRILLLCTSLSMASMVGVPMRAEEIEELMRHASQPKIVCSLRDQRDTADDPIQKLLGLALRRPSE